jgi:hypothetical protein
MHAALLSVLMSVLKFLSRCLCIDTGLLSRLFGRNNNYELCTYYLLLVCLFSVSMPN